MIGNRLNLQTSSTLWITRERYRSREVRWRAVYGLGKPEVIVQKCDEQLLGNTDATPTNDLQRNVKCSARVSSGGPLGQCTFKEFLGRSIPYNYTHRCYRLVGRIARRFYVPTRRVRLPAEIYDSLEQQTVLGHGVNDSGHREHGAKHADQKTGHRAGRHDHLTSGRAHLHEHVQQGGVLVDFRVRHWKTKKLSR